MRWLLLLIALVFGSVQSKEPTPTPPKIEQPPQAHPNGKKQNAAANKRGAPESPIVVELKNTGKSPEETADDKKERAEKSSADWWMIKLTGVLGILALLQLVAFIVQAIYLGKTVSDSRDRTRRELRPYVGPESLFFTEKEFQSSLVSAPPRRLKLCVRNFGKTPAYFVSVSSGIVESPIKGDPRPIFDATIFNGQVIYPEQTHEIDLALPDWASYDSNGFLVYSRIQYFDPLSKMEWTFELCRQYLGKNSFIPYGAYNNETGVSRTS